MDNQKLNAAIKTITKVANDQEKLVLPLLVIKAEKAAEQDPHDTSVVTAAKVLRKMASSNLTITRAEFNRIYDKISTPQSNLKNIFANELNLEPLPSPKTFERSDFEGQSIDNDYARIADPILSNALNAAFDNKPIAIYSKEMSLVAQKAVLKELNAHGVPPKKVDVFAGQEDVIICQASYETPKGYSHVLVPVEMRKDRALLPTMFFGGHGFMDLNKSNVENYVISTAGKSFYVDGQKMLQVLSEQKHGVKKIASDIEMAAIKLKAMKQAAPHDPNGIVAMEIDNPQQPVFLPQAPVLEEHESIGKRLAKADGAARFIYGDRVVESARNVVIRKIQSTGYMPQTKIADVDENRIMFDVNVGSCGFTVPVKVADNRVCEPTVMVANGELKGITAENIRVLGFGDTKVSAKFSPSYELGAQELYDDVKKALAEGNVHRAEDSINVLSQKDVGLAKAAIVMFGKYLSGKMDEPMTKEAAKKPEGVYWMSHKVFFPEGV